MCGIHGFVDRKLSGPEQNRIIQAMVASTPHRGPDAACHKNFEGASLGHNRLSILDLSEAGTQPFTINEYTIVFNGEIYNYRELKTELEKNGVRFHTGTDTEVLLQSYILWGKDCQNRFLGMWSFAVWNEKTAELFISRDRFGIKPFFYVFEDGRFYFASEIKSLKQAPVFSNDLNLNQLSRTLQLGQYTQAEETLFSRVKVLLPGQCGSVKNGCLELTQYWQLETNEAKISDDEIIDSYGNIFLDSLRLHLRSDVPLAATLSGGIDSSAIVCSIMDKLNLDGLNTFSVYYEGPNSVDERPFIYSIADKYQGRFIPHYLSPDSDRITEEFNRITHINDFPLAGSSAISQYFVMQEIAKHGIKVVLSGQGADDYLGGYMHSYYRLYAELFSKLRWGTAVGELRHQRKFQELSPSKTLAVLAKSALSVMRSETDLYRTEYAHYLPNPLDFSAKKSVSMADRDLDKFNGFHYQLMTSSSLPQLLHYEDRNSMAASIESRVPFLDHRLVELGFSAPTRLKIRKGYTKWMLREAVGASLPEKIRFRVDKKGFVTPGEVNWLRSGLSHLLDIDYVNFPHLKADFTRKIIADFKKGDNKNIKLVWRLATMNHWLKAL